MKKILLFLFAAVISIAASADEITFDFSAQGYTNAQDFNSQTVDLGSGISVTFSKGTGSTTPKYYDTGTAMRLYGGNTATFTSNYTITSIVATYSAAGNVGTIEADCGNYSLSGTTGTWTGSSTSIELKNMASSGHARLQKVVITYSAGETTAAKPSLTKGGVFTTKPYAITITNNESGATVYYTMDGTDPTTESASFTGESKQVEINETTTVKAMAVIAGKENSSVASATYTYEESIANTLETAYTTAQAISLIDANSVQLKTTKVYVKGQVSKVDKFNEQFGSIQYWLDNDAFEIYGGLDNNGEKFADIDAVKTGADVVVYGLLKKYNSTYEMDQNNWLVSYTPPTKPEPTLIAEVKTNLEVGNADVYEINYTGDAQEYHFTSSDETVATIEFNEEDLEFKVTALKVGTTTITISTDETDNYQAKTFSYKLNVSEKFVPAVIPFEFDGGKADITPGKGMTATGLGTDYTKSPKLKFDSNGDKLIINIASEAKYLNYVIKGNGSGSDPQAGEFNVEESADGETYTSLKSYSNINGQFAVNNVELKADTRYIRYTYVTKTVGNVALGEIKITNETSAMACATLEEYILEPESVLYVESETPSTPWTSGGYTFTTYTADYGEYGKYYFSYAMSDKTTTEGKLADYALESACGKAMSGKNYAVWCDNSWNGGSKVTLDVPSAITGFYVTNTTSAVDAIINGDGMSTVAGGFQNGDYFKLIITGYDALGNETGSVEYTMAEAKDDKIYYVKAWRWVDLSDLGVVSAIDTKMVGTKTNEKGLTTPAYFCMDDLGGVAPETDAEMEVTDIPAGFVVGDANGNGEVEIGDVTSVLTLMATPDTTGYNNKAADANCNGEIEIGDVTTILTIMAGN
ncbi:MAG: DUF4465 domain-containing protein [Bacteroidaceae bacterium]|nr:DUF4465 domain-containing protein [Bacteroidaceae bacterium]